MTTVAPPQRVKHLEGTTPVSDRLGITKEMLRDIARESGLYIQRKPNGPMYWTPDMERRLVEYIETNYAGPGPRTDDTDPFA